MKINKLLPYPNEFVPEDALKKAEKELRETPEIKQMALKELKIMLRESSKTKEINFEDDYLIHYLRASKYRTGRAFTQLKNYVDYRRKNNYLFQGLPDEHFSARHSMEAFNILPERCLDGCIVYYVQLRKWIPSETSMEEMKQYFMLYYIQLFRDPMVQINGFKAIYDMAGTNIDHLRSMTLNNLYFLYHMPLNCCPSRVKGMHFVNPNIVLKTGWTVLHPFLPEKIKKRCHFHSDVRKLLDFFPASMLPEQYGGNLSNVDSSELARRLNKEQQIQSIQGQSNFY